MSPGAGRRSGPGEPCKLTRTASPVSSSRAAGSCSSKGHWRLRSLSVAPSLPNLCPRSHSCPRCSPGFRFPEHGTDSKGDSLLAAPPSGSNSSPSAPVTRWRANCASTASPLHAKSSRPDYAASAPSLTAGAKIPPPRQRRSGSTRPRFPPARRDVKSPAWPCR